MAPCTVCGEPEPGFWRSIGWRTCHAPITTDDGEPGGRCEKTYYRRCYGYLPQHKPRVWFGGKRCVGDHEFGPGADSDNWRPSW